MKNIENIFEDEEIEKILKKWGILNQYKNNKNKLVNGYLGKLDFKERKPKGTGIYSFRINKQFRAFGYFRELNFIVVEISNHQN